jgi:hypothetical protein
MLRSYTNGIIFDRWNYSSENKKDPIFFSEKIETICLLTHFAYD